MNLLDLPLLNISPLLEPLLEPLLGTLLLSLLLSLLLFPIAAVTGWILTTRRITPLLRWVVWGALWSALLTPTRLVVSAIPFALVEQVGVYLLLGGILLLFLTPWGVLYAARLFTATALVGGEQRDQMGMSCRIAPYVVVRPLLSTLWVWSFAISLIAVLFDFGVAEQLQVETLPVVLYTDEQPDPMLLLHFVVLLLFGLALLRAGLRRLPKVDPQQVERERIKMGVGSYLLLLSTTLLYIPLGLSLGLVIHG